MELSSIIICKSLCQIEPCGVSAAGSSFVKQSRECGRVFVMAKYVVQLVLGKWQKLSLCKRRRRNDDDDMTTNEKSRDIYSGDHNFNPFHAWSTSYSSSVPSVLCINVWQTGLDPNKVKKKRTRQWGTTEKEKDSDY